jgi:hypothetical protein
MIAVEGGEDAPHTSAAITLGVLRAPYLVRTLLATALAVLLWSSSSAAFAVEAAGSADKRDDTLVFGLTATQLAIAAAVGAGAGAAGGLASGDIVAAGASLGFGTLAAIYVAHLAVEALLVGGVYYWWPWDAKPEPPAARTMAIRGAETRRATISILRLSQ